MYCQKCMKNITAMQNEMCRSCEAEFVKKEVAQQKVDRRHERRTRIPFGTRLLLATLLLIIAAVFIFTYLAKYGIRAPHEAHRLGAPISVSGTTIASGSLHVAVVNDNGELWTWGGNFDGQVGDGSRFDRFSPVHIMNDVAAVVARDEHTMAIRTDGSLWAWGWSSRERREHPESRTSFRNYPVHIMDNIT